VTSLSPHAGRRLGEGVGRVGLKPPTFLSAGDLVTLGIDGRGEQRQKIVQEEKEVMPP
jgi:2-keto-4-pentenoate hydratase/2-oxohepta-3-ene-1,7-dioic acid hydratase in catechol pathway